MGAAGDEQFELAEDRDSDEGKEEEELDSGGTKPRRVRKGKELSFADVSRHFDLPLTQAAERLNVCVTLVKRVCRENGVSRWPYRKLQSRKKKERIAREALVTIPICGGLSMDPAQQFPVYLHQQAGCAGWMGGLAGAGNVAGSGWAANPGMQHSVSWPH
ncbi:RWP-RK domain-containing protein [Pavlovales sp. CCMP2436]|nr:RWP-RK domain-containing protein [Pavlovales sp. CCMP2436]